MQDTAAVPASAAMRNIVSPIQNYYTILCTVMQSNYFISVGIFFLLLCIVITFQQQIAHIDIFLRQFPHGIRAMPTSTRSFPCFRNSASFRIKVSSLVFCEKPQKMLPVMYGSIPCCTCFLSGKRRMPPVGNPAEHHANLCRFRCRCVRRCGRCWRIRRGIIICCGIIIRIRRLCDLRLWLWPWLWLRLRR